MIDLKKINTVDPLKRMVEKKTGGEEYSPMDPPDAYAPPVLDTVPYEQMHRCLQRFMDEHRQTKEKLDAFENALIAFKKNGWQRETEMESDLSSFFAYLDNQLVKHHLKEEKVLFPILQKKLIERGEHSNGRFPKTAIDMLEDDHLKIMQHFTLMFNFLSLGGRLPDAASRTLTFDVAIEQGFELIELLKLHLFREENVVFPKANNYLTSAELNNILDKAEVYTQY